METRERNRLNSTSFAFQEQRKERQLMSGWKSQ
jgi:hypothetical protein